MKFSIIVPVYNDPHFKNCLDSLIKLDYPQDQFEIIVVDNNPTPVLQSLTVGNRHACSLHSCFIRYVHEPIPGSYQARNTGLAIAQGDIIAFTDSDCTVDSQWLHQIEKTLGNADAVMGYAHGNNANTVATFEQHMYEDNIAKFILEPKLRRIDTRNFAMKREVYNKIGGFNPRLNYGGDMEYGARIHRAGCTTVFSKTAVVVHSNETNLPKLLQKRIRQNAGNMIIRQIHDEKFVQEYFPHLLRRPFPLTPFPKGTGETRSSPFRGLRGLLWLWSKLTFWVPGAPFGYKWFKLQNVVAMRLGQMTPPSIPPLQGREELIVPPLAGGGKGEVTVSIIVLSWNSKDITRECVDSIINNVKDVSYELILIDNASHDGSTDMIRERYSNHPNIRLVFNNTNLGYASGNNQGYTLAQGKYILLLNSDTLIPERTVETLTKFLERYPQYGGVTVKLLNPDGTTQYFMHRRLPTMITLIQALIYKRWRWFCSTRVKKYLYLDKDFTTDFDIEQAAGTCILLRREAIENSSRNHENHGQLFDAQHFPLYYNDVDLCFRLHQAGWRVRCLTNVYVAHHKGVSVRKLTFMTNLKRYLPAVYWYWRLDR